LLTVQQLMQFVCQTLKDRIHYPSRLLDRIFFAHTKCFSEKVLPHRSHTLLVSYIYTWVGYRLWLQNCKILHLYICILNVGNIYIFPTQLATSICSSNEKNGKYIYCISHIWSKAMTEFHSSKYYNIHRFFICSNISAGLLAKAVSLKAHLSTTLKNTRYWTSLLHVLMAKMN